MVFLGGHLSLLALHWSGVWRSVPTFVMTCLLAFIAAVIAHNHMHLGIFRGRRANSLFSVVLSFGFGEPPTGIVTAHNERHHRHCDSELDFVRCAQAKARWNWVNFLVFPFVAVRTMMREKDRDLRRWKVARPKLYRQALLERGVFWAVLLLALLADPMSTLIYLAVPWAFGQFCIIGINLLQHQDCDPGSEFDFARNVTGRLANWVFLNSGFHTAHHLRPGLHWSKLPEYHAQVVAPGIDPRLVHGTLLGALWQRLTARAACRENPAPR